MLPETLKGLIERVTNHNLENGFTQADTLDGRLGCLCCHREMVGNGSDVRRGIAGYLSFLAAIRQHFGYDRGSLLAGLITCLPLIGLAMTFIARDWCWADILACMLVSMPLSCFLGIVVVFYTFLVGGLIVDVVDWLDNLMQTKPQQDQ